jgi:hypothetical protein
MSIIPSYSSGYPLLTQRSWDISANNLLAGGYAVFGDNSNNLVNKYLKITLPSTNIDYCTSAVVGSLNCYGTSTDVSGASTGTYYSNSVSAMRIPADSSNNRPPTSLRGYVRYNTDTNYFEYYNNSLWSSVLSGGLNSATTTYSGYSISYIDVNNNTVSSPVPGGFTIYSFTTAGTGSFTPNFSGKIVYLVIAGGGGGGNANGGGGGGAGGFIFNDASSVITGTSYTVTVGAGGAASTGSTVLASNGSNSVFGSSTAIGGGGGNVRSLASGGPLTGGSGGGGAGAGTTFAALAGSGTPGQGFSGGLGSTGGTESAGGGGGGAGQQGLPGINGTGGSTPGTGGYGGNGGSGLSNSITGTLTYYAGGGGGGTVGAGLYAGVGGLGGGGNGGTGGSVPPGQTPVGPTTPTANTGSGGGGGGGLGGNAGTAGATGIVIIRFPSYQNTYLQIASPELTGIPTAPTASYSTNSAQIATTAFVQNAVGALQPGGRLTLQSNTPVMNTDVNSAATFYYCSFQSSNVPIYNGSVWTNYFLSSQLSFTTSGTYQGTAIYDIYIFLNNGVLTLGINNSGWSGFQSSIQSRNITQLNGIWVNSLAVQLNGGALGNYTVQPAYTCTYIGSGYFTSGNLTMNFNPAKAVNGTNNQLNLYNAYNRVLITTIEQDSSLNWTYASTGNSIRSANGSNLNRITVLDALGQSFVSASYSINITPFSNWAAIGIGINSTTGYTMLANCSGASNSYASQTTANLTTPPLYGYNYYQALESNANQAVQYGSNLYGFNSYSFTLSTQM